MGAAVFTVIPTFRPDNNLLELLSRIASPATPVLVVDDGSPCTSDMLLREVSTLNSVRVQRHRTNRGIARGLNAGLEEAYLSGSTWLLTIDQDSHVDSHYVAELLATANQQTHCGINIGALGAEVVNDTSGQMRYPLTGDGDFARTEELIQTGTLWNVEALRRAGGFEERLGMDAVDAAACLELRSLGYEIGVSRGLTLQHSIGKARQVLVGDRSIMITGHSPERRASMMRNRLMLFPREFRQSPKHAVRTLRRVFVNQSLGLLVENDRWAKTKGTLRGLSASGKR